MVGVLCVISDRVVSGTVVGATPTQGAQSRQGRCKGTIVATTTTARRRATAAIAVTAAGAAENRTPLSEQ